MWLTGVLMHGQPKFWASCSLDSVLNRITLLSTPVTPITSSEEEEEEEAAAAASFSSQPDRRCVAVLLGYGCRLRVPLRAEGSPDVVQLRVRRLAGQFAGAARDGAAAAATGACEDGQRERGQGDLRAARGGGAQRRRPQALQPAQGEGHRAALAGHHRVLQDHRRRRQTEAGLDPPGQEER